VPVWQLCLPTLLPFKLVLFWPLIDANISDQLPKSHKMACKAYRYDFSQKRSASNAPVCFPVGQGSAGMPYRSPTVPLRALAGADINMLWTPANLLLFPKMAAKWIAAEHVVFSSFEMIM